MSRKIEWLIIVFTLGISLTLLLTGCQLAQPDGVLNTNSENLWGVFVTIGSSDISLSEQSLEPIDFTVDSNGKPSFREDDWRSLYKREVEGIVSSDGSIKFEGIDGYYMGVVETEDGRGETYSIFMADSGFLDGKLHVNLTDGSEESCYDATLLVGTDFNDIVYVNPVYKREDGTYYTIIGQQIGFFVSATSTGQLYSHTLDSTVTRTEDGTTHSDKVIFKVNITVVDQAKQIFIKEMNQRNEVIKNTEYFLSSPEKFIADNNTAYIIVEEIIDSSSSQHSIKRSIYSLEQKDLGDEMIGHLHNFPGENKILDSRTIQFVR